MSYRGNSASNNRIMTKSFSKAAWFGDLTEMWAQAMIMIWTKRKTFFLQILYGERGQFKIRHCCVEIRATDHGHTFDRLKLFPSWCFGYYVYIWIFALYGNGYVVIYDMAWLGIKFPKNLEKGMLGAISSNACNKTKSRSQ